MCKSCQRLSQELAKGPLYHLSHVEGNRQDKSSSKIS